MINGVVRMDTPEVGRSSIVAQIYSEHLEVRVHEQKARGPGAHDNDWVKELSLEEILGLEFVPLSAPENYFQTAMVWVPFVKKWIGFNWTGYPDACYGPNEEKCIGPYRLIEIPPPSHFDELLRDDEPCTLAMDMYYGGKLFMPKAICSECRQPKICHHAGEVSIKDGTVSHIFHFSCGRCHHHKKQKVFSTTSEIIGKDRVVCPYCTTVYPPTICLKCGGEMVRTTLPGIDATSQVTTQRRVLKCIRDGCDYSILLDFQESKDINGATA